jgi:predicted nucleic acid-binding protein
MSADALVYFDSSALVKLAVEEAESAALHAFVTAHRRRVSCALSRVEVPRAARAHGAESVRVAYRVLNGLALVPMTDALLDSAATLGDAALRSLDAIHVAAALTLGEELTDLVTYDRRMAEAATAHGLTVVAPGS